MDWMADQNSDLTKILAVDMQDLDSTRSEYESHAQEFARQHDMVVTVVLACAVILKLSGVWWMSVFVFLIGAAIITVLRARKLAAEKRISQIDREIRQKSLEILSNRKDPKGLGDL
jgi:Mg2+/citrate symporter